MEQTNSWGRKIKNIISVTFKKDEDDLKLFVNEQPNPADYLKMLIAKDMKNINFSIPPQITVKDQEISSDEHSKDIQPEISDSAKERLLKIMEDGE